MVLEPPEENQQHEEYSLELERPYGEYNIKMFYKEKQKEGENAQGEGYEMQGLDDKFLQYFRDDCEPEPISRDKQRSLDEQEEKENKEKEREARQAQKELE